MKLHEHIQQRMNLVGRYGTTGIEVNGHTHTGPVILAPGFVQSGWIDSAAGLAVEALAPIWPLEPRIVLLGGSGLPAAAVKALRSALAARQVALEAMDLGAACRTYNVLAQEERAVVALLFPS